MNLPALRARKNYQPRNRRRVAVALARYRARRMQLGDQRYVEYAALAYVRCDRRRLEGFYAWLGSV